MNKLRAESSKDAQFIQSFEVTNGGTSGDLISQKREQRPLKVGLLATAYFEYYRMYDGLYEKVCENMQKIADAISPFCDLVYPGVVDTLDKSSEAGLLFRREGVEAIIIAEGTYSVDYLVHQALLEVSEDMPLLLFGSQAHSTLDFNAGYAASLLNSGPMGIVQFACSLHKMKRFTKYEVVIGCIDDPEVVEEIKGYIKIHEAIRNLHYMNIGLVGHIFRGMYDFQYDKTDLTGKLGPHVMDIDIKHLMKIYHEIPVDDVRVMSIMQEAREKYQVAEEISELDLQRAARLGAALSKLIEQYKLDGLALLGQHFIETETQTTSYVGVANILSKDQAIVVTEGDVLGLILSSVMKEISGVTPFFGEWEEVDTALNAVSILGHGFIDPRVARKDRPVKLGCSCEEWGWEGQAPGFEATLEPGPATLAAIISHGDTWKILISEGEIPDIPALEINESTVVVQMEEKIRDYYRHVVEMGFGHHVMVVPGHIGRALEMFARQKGFEICKP